MQRSIQQLVAVFILLTAIAWWITGRVAISNSLRDFFLGEEESSTQTEASPGDQEKVLIEKAVAELPPPPAEHSPEVAELISRLAELQTIPAILVNAVKRDRETPKEKTPPAWSDAEVQALRDYQAKFGQAWEPFLSGPVPDWAKFPDSAIFFRSHFPPMDQAYRDILRYGFYEAEQPPSWGGEPDNQPEFYLRLFRQTATLGALRFGGLSGWAITDMVRGAELSKEMIRKSDYFFSPQSQNPEELLPLAPPPPTVVTLREGLKTDRAVFSETARYLESLPPQTPAKIGLTRLLGDEGDASWFVSHVNDPKTVRDLATILRQGADQISLLEQKTYLSGPAWRQWLSGNLESGISPALQGALEGIQDFEKTTLEYQVSLAFLQASAAYRKSGVQGMRSIPDPARPGTFLTVINSTNGITLSSVFQSEEGEKYSFSFEPLPAP
jgi:hypothetical protein